MNHCKEPLGINETSGKKIVDDNNVAKGTATTIWRENSKLYISN